MLIDYSIEEGIDNGDYKVLYRLPCFLNPEPSSKLADFSNMTYIPAGMPIHITDSRYVNGSRWYFINDKYWINGKVLLGKKIIKLDG